MKRGAFSSILFALACLVTTVLSARILGEGMWGTVIAVAGMVVAISPHVELIRGLGRAIALIAAILAFLAVALGLLAATTGRSFRLPADQAWLLIAIGSLGVFGIAVSRRLSVAGAA